MKKILVVLLIVVTMLSCFEFAEAGAKSNWDIAKDLCHKKGYYNILLIDTNKTPDSDFWEMIESRKGKPYIVVERIVSTSDGTGYGWYFDCIIGYNQKVPKGKKVVSYVIYNPVTNYCDDILYVVDNNKYRK